MATLKWDSYGIAIRQHDMPQSSTYLLSFVRTVKFDGIVARTVEVGPDGCADVSVVGPYAVKGYGHGACVVVPWSK